MPQVVTITAVALNSGYKRVIDLCGSSVASRVAVVLAALIIIFLRTPTTFTNPQFWGEDIILFYGARTHGWSALSITMAGYLVSAQFLVGILAGYLKPAFAPLIYNYAAVCLTLVVVWLVTSPRLNLPTRPLLALAVVIVPMAWEELGTIINIQWILPIGVFVLLFMDPPKSRIVLFGEAMLVALTSFSGPFALFLTPLFVLKLIIVQQPDQRHRLAVLTAIATVGALTQVFMISSHEEAIYSGPVVPYSLTLWINLPFERILTIFGPISNIFRGFLGAVLGVLMLAVGVALASRPPFRLQKIFMILFATALSAAGMYKNRVDLGNQIILGVPTYGGRYFYVASVFALWFICCLSSHRYFRFAGLALVALTELTLLPVVANTPRITADLKWPIWAKYIESGLPVIIPTSPPGWYLDIPAAPVGPLAKFASWLGSDINQMAPSDPSACSGTIRSVLPLNVTRFEPNAVIGPRRLWSAAGFAGDVEHGGPASLVALFDQTNTVIGFGLPGFGLNQGTNTKGMQTEWIGNVLGKPGVAIHAVAILGDGQHVCRLAESVQR